nr:uncharacterized protein LOC111421495 [Onthophagus taurus]
MDLSVFVKVLLILSVLIGAFATKNDKDYDYHRKSPQRKRKNHRDQDNNKDLDEKKDVKKYFQDIYSAQLIPDEKEFGHVFEDPLRWEQRFEKIHLDNNRHQGKVKWGDDKGGYGEYYFDFNHGGGEDDDGDKENEKNDEKTNKKGDDIDLYHHDDVEILPGYDFKDKAPYHGGNYKKLD